MRKFRRKSKKKDFKEKVLLVPEDYSASRLSAEEQYRQYFLFWKCWHDELITALSTTSTQKKRISCSEEVIKNLVGLQGLLDEERAKELDKYIVRVKDLKKEIASDIYGQNCRQQCTKAEVLKRSIWKEYATIY